MTEETNLREASENYLEAILKLEDEDKNVRSIDVANELGVSRPSVNKAIGVLKKEGMVEQQPYGRITLTEQGRRCASAVTKRHKNLKRFLTDILGVEDATADNDACKMEHVVSYETMDKLVIYLKNLEKK